MSAAGTLLFDLDGTLTDSRPGIFACIRHALARLDVAPPGDAELAGCLGPPLRVAFAGLLGSAEPARIEHALVHYRERFDAVGWRENAVYDGIDGALAALAASGYRMLVCTSKPDVYARRIVEHFGLDRHLAGVYGPGLDGRFDDKRALLAHLLASEGCAAGAAHMIGDRRQDLDAARANGTRAVGVLWGYGSRDELAGCDRLVASPAALPGALSASSA
ncbi:MAG TPA: HAD hydrolase-like protein [Casimicrobiaceae bacterium]|jgi:phosphoglycolate phosphatase